ncbi:MAG: TonB-dependent receptor [Pseudomonadota bacterium]|jgi:iron complex outermembrane receptor protein
MALLAFGSLAWADEGDEEIRRLLAASPEELMTMTVTIAAQTPQPLARASAVVSVITADDIRATGTTNLMEILQSVPGIYVKSNLFGAKPLITLRGASGVNVLLMINGAPVKDLVWSPGIFWKGMPAHLIERIEIVRGPGSALFGSDASAGVINVITKTAARLRESEAGLRAGTFDTGAAWLQHGAQWNGFDIALAVDLSSTDGHNPFIRRAYGNTSGRADYGYESQDWHMSVARGSWRMLFDHSRHDNVAIGLTGGAVLDPQTRANDSLSSLALLYEAPEFAEHWALNGEFRYRDMEYSSGNGYFEGIPAYADLKQESSAERRLNFEISALYKGLRDHALRFGGGYVEHDLYAFTQVLDGVPKVIDNGESYTFLPTAVVPTTSIAPRKRKNSYFFVQDIWSFARDWELTAGLRYDHYSDFGGTFNPRLALVWQTTDRLTTKLMYGQAFRAPSYLERYVTTAANPPNPALLPEQSKTLELSFAWRASRDLKLGASLYRFDRRYVIAPNPPVSGQFSNHDRFVTSGIELDADWQALRNLRLSGNLSHMKNEEVTSPLRDVAIPRTQAYLRADWAFRPKWSWNLQMNWFGPRPLPAGDLRASQGSYALIDTTVRYYHGSNWEFAASIRNLLDEDAADYSSTRLWYNLPLPGRQLYAEMRYKF